MGRCLSPVRIGAAQRLCDFGPLGGAASAWAHARAPAFVCAGAGIGMLGSRSSAGSVATGVWFGARLASLQIHQGFQRSIGCAEGCVWGLSWAVLSEPKSGVEPRALQNGPSPFIRCDVSYLLRG